MNDYRIGRKARDTGDLPELPTLDAGHCRSIHVACNRSGESLIGNGGERQAAGCGWDRKHQSGVRHHHGALELAYPPPTRVGRRGVAFALIDLDPRARGTEPSNVERTVGIKDVTEHPPVLRDVLVHGLARSARRHRPELANRKRSHPTPHALLPRGRDSENPDLVDDVIITPPGNRRIRLRNARRTAPYHFSTLRVAFQDGGYDLHGPACTETGNPG